MDDVEPMTNADDITYGIMLYRMRGETTEQTIDVNGYGLLQELFDDLAEMIEKENFDVTG